MIVIYPPEIEVKGNKAIISSKLKIKKREDKLWYTLPVNFESFLVIERLDAFVVGLLPLALKSGSDIYVKGAISSRLIYSINKYLINALCIANPEFIKINVFADQIDDSNLNVGNVAGTGLSCGVDSFATYYDHLDEKQPFKIEYLTFFNVGSNGDYGGEKSREIFLDRLKSVKEFAANIDKEVIFIDSNLSEILKSNFQKTHTLRSVSCILLLQKLFKNYYYASSVRFDQFKLDNVRIAEYDLLNLQMLSTESTTFFSSASQYDRIERIQLLMDKPDTYLYLDVCTNPKDSDKKAKNCSRCNKCLRTMLTLDLLGGLEKYSQVFDLQGYVVRREKFIGYLLFKSNKETLDLKLLNFVRSNSGEISMICYFYGFNFLFTRLKKKIKKTLNRK